MSPHLSVNLLSFLLELAICDAKAPVPIGDLGKEGKDLPNSRESAAILDVVGVEGNADVIGSRTPARANDGFVSERFFFEETVSPAPVQDSGGAVYTSSFSLWNFFILTLL